MFDNLALNDSATESCDSLNIVSIDRVQFATMKIPMKSTVF